MRESCDVMAIQSNAGTLAASKEAVINIYAHFWLLLNRELASFPTKEEIATQIILHYILISDFSSVFAAAFLCPSTF